MNRLLVIIFASFLMTGCAGLTGKVAGGGNEAKLKVGDTVVFKLSRGTYGEGKIETIDGSRYKIPYGTTTPTVDESDVYSLPKAGTNGPSCRFKTGEEQEIAISQQLITAERTTIDFRPA